MGRPVPNIEGTTSGADGGGSGGSVGSGIDPGSRLKGEVSGNDMYTFLLQQFPYVMQFHGLPYEFVGGEILESLLFTASGASGTAIEWLDSGAKIYSSGPSQLTINNSLIVSQTFSHLGSTLGFYGATPVSAQTYTTSAVTTTRTINADSITINELADVVGTLVNDLKNMGLLD